MQRCANLPWRRAYQKYTHPQLFIRDTILTDGSMTRITSLVPSPHCPPPALQGGSPEGSQKISVLDGDCIASKAIHNNPAPLRLNADSAMHPSWDPARRRVKGVLADANVAVAEGVAKFRKRFGNVDDFLDACEAEALEPTTDKPSGDAAGKETKRRK